MILYVILVSIVVFTMFLFVTELWEISLKEVRLFERESESESKEVDSELL